METRVTRSSGPGQAVLRWKNRRRFWLLALVLVVIGWVIYLPARPYRPFCGDKPFRQLDPIFGFVGVFGGRDDLTYFGRAMSPEFRKYLKRNLRVSDVPYVSLGPYVIVPVIGVLDGDSSWDRINDMAVVSSTLKFRNGPATPAHVKGVIARYDAAWDKRFFDDDYPHEEYLKHWCALVEAMVTPGWAGGGKGAP